MIVFPNAKINLGLFVIFKRADGYHDIETLFFPLNHYRDVLEVIPNSAGSDEFTTSGIVIDGQPSANICLKALRLMREVIYVPAVKIHLHKAIPTGAGLGGGSADAAFMLSLLNQKFNAGLTVSDLEQMAVTLGADCPVFINNRPVLARGIGNEFHPVQISLARKWLQVVTPPIHVPTATAYGLVVPRLPRLSIETIVMEPVERWRGSLVNDFEPSVFHSYPVIGSIKEKFYNEGALFALMSGSGSSVFAIFEKEPLISWPEDYKVHTMLVD